MTGIDPLPVEALYRRCDPAGFSFETTDQIPDLEEIIGQDRALGALHFGIGIRHDSFNLYALGPSGLGKHALVNQLLEQRAAQEPVPDDWCYVHNFDEVHKPRALRLPAGRASALRHDMEQLVEELRAALPAAFESEDFRTRREAIEHEARRHHEEALGKLQKEAEERHIALLRTPVGMAMAPTRDGEPLNPAEFERLPQEEQERIKSDMETLQKQLQGILRELPQHAREARNEVRDLVREATSYAVGHLIDELRKSYADLPEVLDYLEAVRQDIVEHAEVFIRSEGEEGQQQQQEQRPPVPLPGMAAGGLPPQFRRYAVNLVVDNSETTGAPVIYEDHPTHQNLMGRIEHISQMGALITDFMLIKGGALHRANGGYLLLDARRVLLQPFAWEELKRTLRAHQIRIESIGQMLSLISTVSLEPQAIPLDVKIVLIGDRMLYYLLAALDPDFPELFKVPADFNDDIDRSDGSTEGYARMLATLARADKLRPLDRTGVARTVERGARLAEDAEKLSLHQRSLSDLLREADYWAAQGQSGHITAEHIQQAIDAQTHRSDRVRERAYEMIRRGTILIDTDGANVGQVNGLAVSQLGGFAFARPSRITARTRLGRGRVVDIEREVELSGPIHSKGVLILQGFLAARYALDHPLSLSASLVFEQSYAGIEGDSASSAELYALLSSLAEVPIRQSLAVTGSVNQHGQVQAIGGVNEKIEGFFDVCREIGLTGNQGVLIPQSNAQHLMLRHDVVDAVREGKFRVYSVATIDQGIEILTGVPAGARGPDGRFPEDTVNARVEAKLVEFAETIRAYAARGRDEQAPPPL